MKKFFFPPTRSRQAPALAGMLSVFLFILLFGSGFALDVRAQAETQSFSVESLYDLFGRKEMETVLIHTTNVAYFYVEKPWWLTQSAEEQNVLRIALAELGLEFQNRIYPVLTSTFGSELKPGIDKDERITIVIHRMGGEAGGYFQTGNVYSKFQSPGSNEREMLYLNSQYIGKPEAKSFLAHEFVHLITVNQKNLLRRVSEATWLDEARAEYAPTLLGYDDTYQGSNLERRVREFIAKPSDALIEWLDKKEDYGSVNLFIQYVVDQYGIEILADSLQSSKTGISSLEEALRKNGFQKDFTHIYKDWVVAVLVNDCALGERYCYRNKNLQNLRITPVFYLLPAGETIFSTYHQALPWSPSWHRLTGGGQKLILEFRVRMSAILRSPTCFVIPKRNVRSVFWFWTRRKKGLLFFPTLTRNIVRSLLPHLYKGTLWNLTREEARFLFRGRLLFKRIREEPKALNQ